MKKIFKIILLILIYVSISIGLYLILKACGLTNVSQIRNFVVKTGAWGYVVFFLFQVITSTFICVIPMEDEVLTAVAILLFGPIKGFFIASFNMFVTSCIQFAMGRYLCKGLIEKMLGDKSISKYQNYLKTKGEVVLPILYAIPLFPHDSLCILAGISKMRFWYFAIVTLIMRSSEIASICFLGSGIIDFASFTVMDWIVVCNIIIIDIYLILKLKKYIDEKINKNTNK